MSDRVTICGESERNHEFMPLTASLLLVLLCFLWGGNLVSIRISNQGVPPIFAAAIRSGTAAVLLWAFARTRRQAVFLSVATAAMVWPSASSSGSSSSASIRD